MEIIPAVLYKGEPHQITHTHPAPTFSTHFQNFTIEQTIAFRGITLSVFEATIVRGELDLEGAFEAFTERVLSLGEVPEADAVGRGGTSSDASEANNTAEGMPRESRNSKEMGSKGLSRASGGEEGAVGERGLVFSVGEVDAITRFVARGLYRNFRLYRMCFEREPKVCKEIRHVQVETPLEHPPLLEAEPA